MTNQSDPFTDMMTAAAELAAAVGWTGMFTAYLGRGDGSQDLRDLGAQYPRAVVCHVRGQQHFSAVLDVSCGILWQENPRLIGKAVQCGYPPNSKVLHVRGMVGLEAMLSTGGQTPQDQAIHAAGITAPHNILPLRLSPSNPPSMAAYVAPGWYWHPSGDLKFFGGDTLSLAAYEAALSAGEHQLVAICLDRDTGDLDSLASTAVAGTNKAAFDVGTIDDLVIDPIWQLSGAVHVYKGQTTIDEVDHYRGAMDARVLFAPAPVARLNIDTSDVSNPPTDAELDAAFGTPAAAGDGFVALVNDDGAGANEYLVWSDGSAWWYVAGTKAT